MVERDSMQKKYEKKILNTNNLVTIVNVPKCQINNNSFLLKHYETKCGEMQTYQLVQPMQKQYFLDEITGLQKQKINLVTLKKSVNDGEN